MSAHPVAAAPPRWNRLKQVLFLALGLMFLFVVLRNERFVFDLSDPAWESYFPVRWWLLAHGLGGLLALVTGPFQFSSRFRQRHLHAHRVIGRCYLAGVAIAVPSSVYLSIARSSAEYQFFLLTLAAAWLIPTAVAFAAVLNGNVQIHRQWMVRSYAITTTFVTARVLTAIPGIGSGGETVAVPAQWCLLVATMLLAEVGLAWRGVFADNVQDSRAGNSSSRAR
jgi:uncharacterized membrane protein